MNLINELSSSDGGGGATGQYASESDLLYPSHNQHQQQTLLRRMNEEETSFLAISRRLKDKYGLADTHSPTKTPYIPELSESLSSRYEKLTGRSPSADMLTSSLDDLLKTLKNKFGGGKKPTEEDFSKKED